MIQFRRGEEEIAPIERSAIERTKALGLQLVFSLARLPSFPGDGANRG